LYVHLKCQSNARIKAVSDPNSIAVPWQQAHAAADLTDVLITLVPLLNLSAQLPQRALQVRSDAGIMIARMTLLSVLLL